MKRALMCMMALALAIALAAPAFAADFKYGGYWRVRIYSDNNVTDDGTGSPDSNHNLIDQRLRMYFYFVASENFRLVTKWEVNNTWGQESSGGDVGTDGTGIYRTKNVYAEIKIPNTPVTTMIGLQGITLFNGWISADDFSAITANATFDKIRIEGGYIAAANNDFTTTMDNVDDLYLTVGYANGPWKGTLYGFYQYSRLPVVDNKGYSILPPGSDSNLFDLGLEVGYAAEKFDVTLGGIANLGSQDDLAGNTQDYKGWMIEGTANFYMNNLAFTLGGFFTSGDDNPNDGDISYFVYPDGRSYYWAEIMGYGTMDQYGVPGNGWAGNDGPSNLWTITAGVAWQALEKTKLTFNYYYIGTDKSVDSQQNSDGSWKTSSEVGNEFDLYIDQKLIDGLNLRLVGAYLLAGDAYTNTKDDDDAYEVGARLDWSF